MDHVVYLDSKAQELNIILNEEKTMIIRGAAGRKMPYGRVADGDTLYFIENNGDGLIKAIATVKGVFNSEKLTEEASAKIISENQDKLRLTQQQIKRWSGKRYLILVEIENVRPTEHFLIDKRDYGNMDDWLPVGEIDKVRV